ncbi:MAG: EAL domain-containing protein [Gammaproteobacteria bacterium]|nr:EAL domain-containing protein [Gammaproteobacteria bacterium]
MRILFVCYQKYVQPVINGLQSQLSHVQSTELQNPNRQSKPRVLIVDEDRDFGDNLLNILALEGHEVELAHNPNVAEKFLLAFTADIALVNIRPGNDSGIDLITSLKRINQDILCVIMSPHVSVDIAIEALKSDAYGYLIKPFHTDELIATLNRCFEHIILARANTAATTALRQTRARLEARVAERTASLQEEVAQRKRIERALRDSEARFKQAAHMAYLGHCTWDEAHQNYIDVSEEYARLFGMSADQLVAMSYEEKKKIVHPEDRQRYFTYANQAKKNSVSFDIEYRIIRGDGAIRHVRELGGPISHGDRQTHCTGTLQDITDRKETELALEKAHAELEKRVQERTRELLYQASHDSLTGLVNRAEFERCLQILLESARTESVHHALCYLDLDQFKIINDTCGHIAGDELLRQLGELLPEWIRKQDTLARLGGDEFGVLLERCSLEQAERVAENIRNGVENFRFIWGDRTFRVGASIGVVAISETSKSLTAMLSAADAACYEAKDQGRNRIHVTHKDDVELARRYGEMQWVSRIQSALEDDRLTLDFQKIVPLDPEHGKGKYYELLLRMQDEQGHLVLPDCFLSAADRFSVSGKLDRWVVQTALQWLATHPDHLNEVYLCSINLSGQSVGNETFLDFVNRVFDETEVPREKICFEITESAAIENLTSATHFMDTLGSSGCRFALDDFGKGLSSFAYLKRLPVNFLKIDGMFIKNIVNDPIDLAMVKSINEIGKVMNKKTIAEFVENDQILERVREIGIDYAQGYGLGVPRPITEAI